MRLDFASNDVLLQRPAGGRGSWFVSEPLGTSVLDMQNSLEFVRSVRFCFTTDEIWFLSKVFSTEWWNWKNIVTSTVKLFASLDVYVLIFMRGGCRRVFVFKYCDATPPRLLAYLVLCPLLSFLGKERPALGTFHNTVIFLDQKQNLYAPAVGKLAWFCRLRIFLEGLQQHAWRCKGIV